MRASIISLAFAALLLSGCATRSSHVGPPDWIEWQARRRASLAGTNGWLTLIGLHWLHEGDNSAGSASTNDAVLRSDLIPAFLGTFSRRGSAMSFTAGPGTDVRVNGEPVRNMDLVSDAFSEPTRLQIGSISIIVLDRGERIGLRVRDSGSEARRNFRGLKSFPYDSRWRVEGRFVPFPEARKMRVPDVTGGLQEFVSPGEIVFKRNGAERRLAVALEPDVPDFFIMFHDETAGETTYPAGRFLYVEKPVSTDRVVIDFNRAYTPPCGFTDFATCPLPPRQNWLPFAIKAGELKPAGAHR